MASATLTRPAPGSDPVGGGARRARLLPALGLGVLSLATLVGFLVYPTYPNYDSYYSLLWGRELLDGIKPSFDGYRTPTEHPLAVAFGALLSLIGQGADRMMVGATLASFVLLVAGLYHLGKASFGWVVGLLAAGLLCSRFDFPFLAARGYIDIPYLGFVVWAAALEAARPRRGIAVFVLLTCAGLMRPEAWLLSGLYWLWCSWHATWTRRVVYALLTGVGPVVWIALDWWATGAPLFSLQHTSGLAEELGRTRGLSDVPAATVQFLKNLDKLPVFYAGVLGLVLAIVLVPRRAVMPGALLAIGLATFGLVGLAGLSVIDRYLLVPSLLVMVFAAVALGGWSMLETGRARTAWLMAAALLAVYGVGYTAVRVSFSSFITELEFRGDSHRALVELFENPKVRAGLRCGPVFTPNHKLVPDTRWVLNAGPGAVLARSDASERRRLAQGGIALIPASRTALLRQGFTAGEDTPQDTANVLPPDGYRFAAATEHYGAYVRC